MRPRDAIRAVQGVRIRHSNVARHLRRIGPH
jgi:hypothetical protein